ncbi:hairy-related 12 [Betta splendens]|uniref:Transcription factor HES-5 n=1 Tax=Betta splendens TaxID=158456 RepID=A0A6P7N3C0_BETSP|nr:hairy-related 12 [Betta splendens]
MLMMLYKKRSSSSRDSRAQHCPPEEAADSTCTDMAPCSTSYSSVHHIRISDKDIKLRKPVVEKMRRDRINSCIEQLKIILEKEFHKQEPNSKLEKADILEMTVSFLRQQLQPGLGHGDYRQGYSHCWRDSLHFLSSGSGAEGARPQGPQLQREQRGGGGGSSSSSSSSRGPAVWRPW